MSAFATAPSTPSTPHASPLVHELARPLPGISPYERVGVAAEWVRVSPYRCVPVVSGGILLGLVTEESLATYLHSAPDSPERRHWLEAQVEGTVLVPTSALSPLLSVQELQAALAEEGVDALPVAESNGLYYGMVGHGDLVRELLRPLALPPLGGMATPVGVHLSTGTVSAGVRGAALVLTGFCFFFTQLSLFVVLSLLEPYLPALPIPPVWRETIEQALTAVITLAAFLGLVRLSPLAGFHAAEHQVVHALERHVPLLVDQVGRMPRVHPRCGTNLLAGSFLLGLGGVLAPLLGEAGYVLSGILALFFWRSLGAWLQEKLTTRPATEAQLTQAIVAAKTLLEHHEARPEPATLQQRLWNSGMPQMFLGFALGVGILALLGLLIPSLGEVLRPHWQALLP
ncbi:DUF1385 domain-containing protein [Armatimonas sp.]|uniref:DUF1385 domain-containing protein n=1 Tax=Armatimonas sp. TaxID=1872638 RepID=UPI00286C7F1A|nr:DUF1385 domain-containing protein [Armatimonas sp.]